MKLTVGDGGELQHSVERTLEVGQLTCRPQRGDTPSHHTISASATFRGRPRLPLTSALIQEVGQQTPHDGLVADDQNVLLPLELHDDRLQTLDQVLIRLRGRV